MAAIMTGTNGILAFWNGSVTPANGRAFGTNGDFHRPELHSFATVSAFAANSNHAPAGYEESLNWDAGVDLLFRIAGAR